MPDQCECKKYKSDKKMSNFNQKQNCANIAVAKTNNNNSESESGKVRKSKHGQK